MTTSTTSAGAAEPQPGGGPLAGLRVIEPSTVPADPA